LKTSARGALNLSFNTSVGVNIVYLPHTVNSTFQNRLENGNNGQIHSFTGVHLIGRWNENQIDCCPSCLVDPNSFPASGVGETLAGDRRFAWKAGFWCGVLAQEVEIDGCGGYGRQSSLNGRNDPLCGIRAFRPLGACSGDAVLRLGGLPSSSPTPAVQWRSVLVHPCPEKGECDNRDSSRDSFGRSDADDSRLERSHDRDSPAAVCPPNAPHTDSAMENGEQSSLPGYASTELC